MTSACPHLSDLGFIRTMRISDNLPKQSIECGRTMQGEGVLLASFNKRDTIKAKLPPVDAKQAVLHTNAWRMFSKFCDAFSSHGLGQCSYSVPKSKEGQALAFRNFATFGEVVHSFLPLREVAA